MSKTPEGATPVGSHFYLFKSPMPSTECLISAHGGHERERTFLVPAGITIHFYALHGFTLNDPGIALLNASVTPKESITGGPKVTCHDYSLSKYQGTHSKGRETYGSINQQVAATAQGRSTAQEKYLQYVSQGQPDWKLGIEQQKIQSNKPVHIATIRNRFLGGDMKLSAVLSGIRKAQPNINTFHCSFCRSSLYFDAGMSHKATMGPEHIF
jgi:hypothetical protein